jgi:inorganic triphosphatase YgiF
VWKRKFLSTKLKLVYQDLYPEVIKRILLFNWQNSGEARVADYETTYYDTLDNRLNQHGFTYRIRKEFDQYVATVKDSGSHQGGLFVRKEWNRVLAEDRPGVEPFLELPIGQKLIEVIGAEPLRPLFKTRFQRTAIDLTTKDGTVIEFAADQGHIISGEQREPLCEIELELKKGRKEELLKLGAALAEHFPMIVEDKSKYARGMILAGLPVPFPLQ